MFTSDFCFKKFTTIAHKPLEIHQILWKIYREFFDNSQMFNIIKHTDDFGNSRLSVAFETNFIEVVMFIWNEIREISIHAEQFNQKLSNKLIECEEYLMIYLKNRSHNKKMETMFNNLIEELKLLDSQKQIERIINKELSGKDIRNLHHLALCDKLEHHEALWQILLKSIENLMKLIIKKDTNGNNFIHLLVFNDNLDTIEFTLNILKRSFSDEQFREILQWKGKLNWNLLQIAAKNAKTIKIHQILWKILQDSFRTEQEFLKSSNKSTKMAVISFILLPVDLQLKFLIL